jgi:hypothetical protein
MEKHKGRKRGAGPRDAPLSSALSETQPPIV